MTNHPITPPLELVQQWAAASPLQIDDETYGYELFIAHHAAQWGADQELEACCEALDIVNGSKYWSQVLRSARRPKPPSLKLQALNDLNAAYNEDAIDDTTYCNIRRALEELPE